VRVTVIAGDPTGAAGAGVQLVRVGRRKGVAVSEAGSRTAPDLMAGTHALAGPCTAPAPLGSAASPIGCDGPRRVPPGGGRGTAVCHRRLRRRRPAPPRGTRTPRAQRTPRPPLTTKASGGTRRLRAVTLWSLTARRPADRYPRRPPTQRVHRADDVASTLYAIRAGRYAHLVTHMQSCPSRTTGGPAEASPPILGMVLPYVTAC